MAENDSFQALEAMKKKGKFEFIFKNSDYILTIPRFYLRRKINSSFFLFLSAQNCEFISLTSGFFSSECTNLLLFSQIEL